MPKPTLEDDELMKLLRRGVASRDDQHHAAEWIKALHEEIASLRRIAQGHAGTSQTVRD